MKKMMKRLALLLAVLTVCSVLFCACGGESTDETNTQGSTEENKVKYDGINGGGREFIVLSRELEGYLFAYEEVDVIVDAESDDRVSSAVYNRDQHINETFGVTVVGSKMTREKMRKEVENCQLGGLQTYDVVMGMVEDSFGLSVSGYLYEWGRIPYVDMTQSYWMTDFYESTTIGGYNFYCPGAANISAYNTVGVTFFNKQIISDLSLSNPYELAKAGTWTVEEMQEMCKTATLDSDGLTGMTYLDTYGLAVNSFVWQPFFYSSGYMMVEKDDNDVPFLSATNAGTAENVNNLLESITKMVNDTEMAILTNRSEHSNAEYQAANLETDIFLKERALFWVENIYGQYSLRDMKDYGILPMPKWNSAGEYISYAHAGHSSVMSVPLTAPDLKLSGAVLEEMTAYSQNTLIPEFYEQTIRLRGVRDAESYEMLDIIYENIIIDLGVVMKYSGLGLDTAIRGMLNFNDTSFSVMFDSQGEGYETKIGELATKFASNAAKQYSEAEG